MAWPQIVPFLHGIVAIFFPAALKWRQYRFLDGGDSRGLHIYRNHFVTPLTAWGLRLKHSAGRLQSAYRSRIWVPEFVYSPTKRWGVFHGRCGGVITSLAVGSKNKKKKTEKKKKKKIAVLEPNCRSQSGSDQAAIDGSSCAEK